MREMFKWIIAMVVALLVVSVIVEPYSRHQVKSFFSDILSGVKDITKKTSSAVEECQERAKSLIPKYLILSTSNMDKQVDNFWNDQKKIDLFYAGEEIADDFFLENRFSQRKCIRKGSNPGENVNLFYLNEQCYSLKYSKKIIDNGGNVIGTNSFMVIPVLKESTLNPSISFETENDYTLIKWEGFSDEAKGLYGVEGVHFYADSKVDPNFKIDQLYDADFGIIELNFKLEQWGDSAHYNNPEHMFRKFYLIPDIVYNKIYEIVDYKIISCNLIKEK